MCCNSDSNNLALVTPGIIIVVVSTMPVQTADSHKGFRK